MKYPTKKKAFSSTWTMVKKESLQIIRDKQTLFMLFFIPLFILFLFGYALNFDLKEIKLAIYDLDKSKNSRSFIDSFNQSKYFTTTLYIDQTNQVNQALNQRKAQVVMIINKNFGNQIINNENTSVQFLIDGADSNTATSIASYVQSASLLFNEKMINTYQYTQSPLDGPRISCASRIWFNPSLDNAKFFVPGLLGFIFMIITVVSTSLSIVREKEKNSMELILASPIKSQNIILGKTLPYFLISIIALFFILTISYFLFNTSIQGSILLLTLASIIFIFTGLGLGLFISTLAHSQQVAFYIAIIATLLPTIMLSGFIYPISNMPLAVQYISYLFPGRYYIYILRTIILKGVGITAFYKDLIILFLYMCSILTIGMIKMKRSRL